MTLFISEHEISKATNTEICAQILAKWCQPKPNFREIPTKVEPICWTWKPLQHYFMP